MTTETTLSAMELCDFSAPVTVTIVYDDDEDGIAKSSSNTLVDADKNMDKHMPIIIDETNLEVSEKIQDKNKSKILDKAEITRSDSHTEKEIFEIQCTNNTNVDNLNLDNQPISNPTPVLDLMSNVCATENKHFKAQKCIDDLLHSVSISLIHVVNIHLKLIEVLEKYSFDSIKVQEAKRYYAKIKYHFFQLSYCTIICIILEQEAQDQFQEMFLNNTVNLAKEKMNLKLTTNQILPLYYEMIRWVKLKKDWIKNLPLNNPFEYQDITNNVSAEKSKTVSKDGTRDNTPEDNQVVDGKSITDKKMPDIKLKITIDSDNENFVVKTISMCNDSTVETSYQQEPISSDVSNQSAEQIGTNVTSQALLNRSTILENNQNESIPTEALPYRPNSTGSLGSQVMSGNIAMTETRNQNELLQREETSQKNKTLYKDPPLYGAHVNSVNFDSAAGSNKTIFAENSHTRNCIPVEQMAHIYNQTPVNHQYHTMSANKTSSGERRYQHASLYNPYQTSNPSRQERSSLRNERIPRHGHTPFRHESVPDNINNNYTHLRYYLNNNFQTSNLAQSNDFRRPDLRSQEHYNQSSSTSSAAVQNLKSFIEEVYNYRETTSLTSMQVQNDSVSSLERSRSSTSTDSGFVSPTAFTAYDKTNSAETQNQQQLTPMITHVTSLNPRALRIETGSCQVCGVATRKMCLGCYRFYYCSYDCLKTDWVNHMPLCKTNKEYQQNSSSFVVP